MAIDLVKSVQEISGMLKGLPGAIWIRGREMGRGMGDNPDEVRDGGPF